MTINVFVDGIGETTAELVEGKLVTADGMNLGTPTEFASLGGMNSVIHAEDCDYIQSICERDNKSRRVPVRECDCPAKELLCQ